MGRTGKIEGITDNILFLVPFFHRHLTECGSNRFRITPRTKVLAMLSKNDAMPISEIGKRIYISKPNMSTLVEELIESGLAHRKHGMEDRRVTYISLTKKGREMAARQKRKLKEIIKSKIAVLGNSDIGILDVSFQNMKRILSKLEGRELHG